MEFRAATRGFGRLRLTAALVRPVPVVFLLRGVGLWREERGQRRKSTATERSMMEGPKRMSLL